MYNFSSELKFSDSFSAQDFDLDQDLLIIDTKVVDLPPFSGFKEFKYRYEVQAGESLKDIAQLSTHLQHIGNIWQTKISRSHRIVVVGGGSVGDFAGFIASIMKRGLQLSHVPSTWLAAIDSSHGGKTALNIDGSKNQVGTFYPAHTVHLIKDVLTSQPQSLALSAFGEAAKVALLSDKGLIDRYLDTSTDSMSLFLWKNLREMIAEKYIVVEQDPYETKKIRTILNLGHTWGHVLESLLQRSHGESVLQGLFFATSWSCQLGLLPEKAQEKVMTLLRLFGDEPWCEQQQWQALCVDEVSTLLQKDKKMNKEGSVDYVFLEGVGRPLVKAVTNTELMSEAKRQGWCDGV